MNSKIERMPTFFEKEAKRLIEPAVKELKALGCLNVFPVPIEDVIQDEFPLEVVKAENLTFANVQHYAARVGITAQGQNPARPLAGYLLAGQDRGAVFVNTDPNSQDGSGRQRHSAAHELGHYLMEARPLLTKNSTEEAISIGCSIEDMEQRDPGRDRAGVAEEKYRHWLNEALANQFASEVLMPFHDVRSLIGSRKPSLLVIDEMAERYDVSFTAAAIRYVKVSYEDCALVVSRGGAQQWFVLSPSLADYGGRFTLQRLQRIDSGTAAYDLHTGRASARNVTCNGYASAWFPFFNDKRRRVREFSRLLIGPGTVISLLWFEGGAYPEDD